MLKNVRKILAGIASGMIGISCGSVNTESIILSNAAEEAEVAHMWGDANCDGEVTVADETLILQVIANPDNYGLGKDQGITSVGIANSDVYQNGDGITARDVVAVHKWLIGEIASLPESYSNPGTETTTTTTTTTSTTTIRLTTTMISYTSITTAKQTTTTSTTITTEPTTTVTSATTAKPTTVTSTTTEPTTTSTTSTTSTTAITAKPTTVTSKTTSTTTTTTTEPTTTSSTNGTTTKPTTVTSTTTSTTTTEPTTTATSATTAKPTTVASTTTSTTTSNQITTTTTSNSFTPPAMEDLVNEEGEQIPEDTYNILLATAKLFNVKEYDIVYSEKLIEGAYFNPGLEYCGIQGMAYGYGVQIVNPEDLLKLDIDTIPDGQEDAITGTWAYGWHGYIRPIVPADMQTTVLEASKNTWASRRSQKYIICGDGDGDPDERAKDEPIDCHNWYLVDKNSNEINLGEYNLDTAPGATSKYYLSYDKMSGLNLCSRTEFQLYMEYADYLNLPDYKIVRNSEKYTPIEYAFVCSDRMEAIVGIELARFACRQIVPTSQLSKVVDPNGNWQEDISYDIFDEEKYPYFFWTPKEFTDYTWNEAYQVAYFLYDDYNLRNEGWIGFYMIPLDKEGNEDLRLFWPLPYGSKSSES
mgnify:CR=1 FL=1